MSKRGEEKKKKGEEERWSGLVGFKKAASKRVCSEYGCRVALLDGDVHSLFEEGRWPGFTRAPLYSAAYLATDLQCRWAPCSKCLYGDWDEYVVSRSSKLPYFARFLPSAMTAADPAAVEERLRCEGARVSGQVKSQTRYLPLCHGSREAPSGRLTCWTVVYEMK